MASASYDGRIGEDTPSATLMPYRLVFLDTCILRFLAEYPDLFYDGGWSAEEEERALQLNNELLVADLEALQVLPQLFRRGFPHGLVVSPDVVAEMGGASEEAVGFAQEFMAWCGYMGFPQPSGLASQTHEAVATVLDAADGRLYQQAWDVGCDGFLTTDYRSIIRRRHRLPESGPRIISPTEWWRALRPWAGLFL
jgi:hypothetical protein